MLLAHRKDPDSNGPVALRSLIEDFKMKVIQDLNSVKRLFQKAENDYYSLYKLSLFLKQSGNMTVLLKLLKNDASASDNVMKIIENFLADD